MARLLFVNRFYWPDETATGQLLTDLAEALAAHGYEVTVVTSRPVTYSGTSPVRNGVHIRHVGSTRVNSSHLPAKALDFATFYLGACWQLLRRVNRRTTVVVMTDPPLMGIAAWCLTRLRGGRIIHWIQDIYPELAIKLAGQGWLRALTPIRNWTWRRADHCVTLGADMAAQVHRAGVATDRLTIMANWAPAGLLPPSPTAVAAFRAARGLGGEFVIGYSGNFGRVHDLEVVLDLAEALRNETSIRFVLAGSGAQLARLSAAVRQRQLSNVVFLPPQPRVHLAESLAAADIHLVTLRSGCEGLVFPSKLYGITAIGRPVIFIGPRAAEICQLITKGKFGITATRDEIAALADAVRRLAADKPARDLLGENARRFASAHGLDVAAAGWEAILTANGNSRSGENPRSEGIDS